MSLEPCRECKAEVSSEAKVCPQCGIDYPVNPEAHATREAGSDFARVIGGLILLGLLWAYCATGSALAPF